MLAWKRTLNGDDDDDDDDDDLRPVWPNRSCKLQIEVAIKSSYAETLKQEQI